MGSVIQIKHGKTTPTSTVLRQYELGYKEGGGGLFINDNGVIRRIGGGADGEGGEGGNDISISGGTHVGPEPPGDVPDGFLWVDTDEDFEGGSGSGDWEPAVSSDWNQNDSGASDYVKNRTHWVENSGVVHCLDEKFIPDTIARTKDLMTREEVIALVQAILEDRKVTQDTLF